MSTRSLSKEDRRKKYIKNGESERAKMKEYREKMAYSRSYLTTRILGGQRSASKKRGHNPPEWNIEELREWIYSQPRFESLMIKWFITKNNYFKPSVDRLDDSKGYTWDNIQLSTWKENFLKQHDTIKNPVLQYDLEGNFIKEWESCRGVDGFNRVGVSKSAKGLIESYKGFVWKYKLKTIK
jgi:hypothetical protein